MMLIPSKERKTIFFFIAVVFTLFSKNAEGSERNGRPNTVTTPSNVALNCLTELRCTFPHRQSLPSQLLAHPSTSCLLDLSVSIHLSN